MKRTWWILLAALAGLSSIVWAVNRGDNRAAVPALTAAVTDAKVVLAVSGQLEPIEEAVISSQLSIAQVQRLYADLGQHVRAGEVLIQLDTRSLDAQRLEAVANLDAALASLAGAQQTLTGARRSSGIAQQNLQSALDLKANRDQAAEEVRVERLRVKVAEIQLNKTRSGGRPEEVRRAEAALASAMASQRDRERNLQRIQTLFQEGAIAKVEVDDAAVAATRAEQDTRSARANLEQVKTPRPEDLAEASANLERERASLRAAESHLKNQQATFDAKFSLRSTAENSQTEVLTSSASISRAQSEVSRCRAKIAQIDVQISQSRITSPINGIISRRSVNIGQTVQSGTQLFRVTSAEAYRAIANVDEKYVWQLNEGQSATIQPEAFPDLQIPAIVEEISREANQDRGTVKVRFRLLKRDGRLRADLSLDINVTTADLSERIVVPDSVLLREGKLVYVMAIIGDTVKKVAVKVDRQTDKGTVLLEGVSEGDVLVSEPRTVTEGQRVVVKAEQQ